LLSTRKCLDPLLRRTQRLRLRDLWNNVRNELDQRAEPAQEVVVNHPITLGHMGKVHQLHPHPTLTSACCNCTSIIAQKNRRRVEVELGDVELRRARRPRDSADLDVDDAGRLKPREEVVEDEVRMRLPGPRLGGEESRAR